MGEDVEEAAGGRLGEGLEVPAPDRIGVAAVVPDRVLLGVHRLVADEVDRSDHEVERSWREHLLELLLPAGHEVGLDAQLHLAGTDRLAVLVEVVERPLLPEVVVPDVQRRGEPVHVLGAAKFGHSDRVRRCLEVGARCCRR